MAQVFAPYLGRNTDVIFGDEATGNHFESHVNRVSVTPSVDTITSKGMEKGAVYQDVTDPTWSLSLEGLQGRYLGEPVSGETAKQAFQKWAFQNHGEKVAFTIRPNKAELTEGLTGTVSVQATPYWFEQGAHSTFSVELPLDGDPEYLDGTKLGIIPDVTP